MSLLSNIGTTMRAVNLKKLIIFIGILVIGGGLLYKLFTSSTTHQQVQGVQVEKSELVSPRAVSQLNKEYTFPINDNTGKKVSDIKYVIEDAQLLDEIIIRGQKATAVKGRTFLIFNLKITNSHNQTISINTRDYIRLSVNNNSELLAPDIHNDPVEIQAISTKLTRVGFPINENDTELKVQVGEINGEKTTFDLKF